MPTSCESCGASKLEYGPDGSGTCLACGRVTKAYVRHTAPAVALTSAARMSATPATPPGESVQPATPMIIPTVRDRSLPNVNWGMGLILGLMTATAGGLVWGVLAGFTGYVSALASVVLGIFVASAVRRGARRVTWPVILMSAAFTPFAIFIGDVVGLTILFSRVGAPVGIQDVVLHYPEILALSTRETTIAYGFGILGTAAGANWLRKQMRKDAAIAAPRRMARPEPRSAPSTGPTGQVLERKLLRVAVRVVASSSGESIEATFRNLTRIATVEVGGTPVRRSVVWGFQKTIQVPITGPKAQVVRLRFHGIGKPKIEVRVDGTLLLDA